MLKRSLIPGLALLSLGFTHHAARAADAADASISGRWKVVVSVEDQRKDYNLELKQDGSKVAGVLVSPRSGRKDAFDGGSFMQGKLKFEVKRESGEVYGVEAEQKGPAKLEGKLLVNGQLSVDLVMTRESSGAIVGKWNVVSKSPDGQEYPSTLEVSEDAGALKGKATSRLGPIDVAALTFDGEKISFEISLPIDGNNVAFRVVADFKDGNKLVGRWKTRDADFSGEWTATREQPPAPEAKPASAPAKGLAGKWFGYSTSAKDGKRNVQLELAVDGGKVTGKVHLARGSYDIQNGKADGNKIELGFTLKVNESDVPVKIEAEIDAHEMLKGKWSVTGGDGGEVLASKATVL